MDELSNVAYLELLMVILKESKIFDVLKVATKVL
jgi:hypothetical protein